MSLPNEPIGRMEDYLGKIAGQDVELPSAPIGRIEEYLDYIARHGGGAPQTETPTPANPLSFTTDSEQVARSTLITFEPIQAGSGDPSPENVRAISGHEKIELKVTGKNLVEGKIVGYNISSEGVTNASASYDLHYAKVIKGTIYVLSADEIVYAFYEAKPSSGSQSYNQSRTVGSGASFTAPITGYVAFRSSTGYATAQLELGSTATAYEPYNPATDITLNLPETLYGFVADVEKGEVTVTHKIVDMGDLEWNYRADDGGTFRASISDKKVGLENIVCEIYKNTSEAYTDMPNLSIRGRSNVAELIYVKDTTYGTDSSAFATGVTGKYIAYELATPYTLHLTPHQVRLLLGANVVTTNGTSIALTYRNGEVASLADVDALAGSVEALNEKCKALPDAPTTDGTYTLTVTVADGATTYSWES